MTHVLSHNPVKLRLVDLKTGEFKKTYVFIGEVPDNIEKALKKIEGDFNSGRSISTNNTLKSFYGANWLTNLGLYKNDKRGGGSEEKTFFEREALDIIGGDEEPMFSEFDNLIELTDEDLEPVNFVDKGVVSEDIVVDPLQDIKTENIDKSGGIKFVFSSVYPLDNILEFKYKIYCTTGIPIFRQHLWFKHKNKSYPCSYNIKVHGNNATVDISHLISHYSGDEVKNDIEGIPIDIEFYKNKDWISIVANDTFTLISNIYDKHGVTEYHVVDLNSLINAQNIYAKLSKDKYQLDLLYYGFIMIYFPIITYQVFTDYIKNEASLVDIYPELLIPKLSLEKKFKLEADITNEGYDLEVKPIEKHLLSSITNTIISLINPKQGGESVFSLRNIFDLIKLTDIMPYCKAYLLHENQRIVLHKSYYNEQDTNEAIPLNSLLIKIKTYADTNENMRFILFKNGNYIIRTNWREENRMTFGKIKNMIIKKINPVISAINKLGNKVRYQYGVLPEISDNIVFTDTGMVFYYDDDITESRFNVLKNVLEDFTRAGILMTKENIILGQEFFFQKGMYKFDSSRIEKAITVSNYYEFLSNGVVNQKWSTIFERTHLMQVITVSSKLKFTINGIRDEIEMENFYMYLLSLLSIYMRNSSKIKKISSETVQLKYKNALKNLKTQDPLLYDFKKIYKSNIVYPKICQKKHQPVILSEQEYKDLPKNKKENAVKYWNFTTEKEVWYSCPNPKYPFIKFIIKQHPKDYCIPCCKKIAMNENVNIKKQEIHKTCLTKHIYSGEKKNVTKGSHYIATYGKNIEVGRLSRLPENTLEPLFFDTYSPEGGIDPECVTSDGYYLLGVDQHTTVVKNVGYLYCLITSLNRPVDEFLAETAKLIKRGNNFRILLNGDAGMYFKDANELADVLIRINDEGYLMLNRYVNVPWNNLLMSIAHNYYGVNTVLFTDVRKTIELILPNNLKNTEEMFPSSHKNLVVLQKGKYFYPIYLINTEVFRRTGVIDTRLFINESGIMSTIHAIVRKHLENSEYGHVHDVIDLAIAKKFVKMSPNISITHYLINHANLCYGIVLKFENKQIYFPIESSYYSESKNIELLFQPYKNYVDYNTASRLYQKYNEWVKLESKKLQMDINIYPFIEAEKWLLHKEVVGFISNNINYYCKPMQKNKAKSIKDIPFQTVVYDHLTINNIVSKMKNNKVNIGLLPKYEQTLSRTMYKQNLYQLVLLHFINTFNKQRNNTLRKKIYVVLSKTDFSKSTEHLREFIKKNITQEDDAAKLKSMISRYYVDHYDKKILVADIAEAYFNFDKIALERLQTLSRDERVVELKRIAKNFVIISNKPFNGDFPNILGECGNESYCQSSKLLIDNDSFETIVSVIADDIVNPMKYKWLFNGGLISKTVNFYKFIRRPSETIRVEIIT